ncbi:hypothetical protein NPX13_g3750 [Xylaria arbuscula]|uniref:Uncharacterized protein n=1 Tax=Xylaria arbuscula TaxID=114810 RepID=A0A9W8TMI9_9PEZI|nr:hypothetical protein NPX13_g3750 [Xylaria arbuscula]
MAQTTHAYEMHLYATGFNAWKQLEIKSSERSAEEPDDIVSFRRVLSADLIEVQYASLSYTIVNTSEGLRCAGIADEAIASGLKLQLSSSTAAIAGNGFVAIFDGYNTITQHMSRVGSTKEDKRVFSAMHDIIQLVAYETGFAALSRDGKVRTWGDERYGATLGREITISSPAESPGLVEDLKDLPSGKITKIAAGGYMILALTEGHDLYAWGGHQSHQPLLENISGDPSPVDVEENDILDFSVGETHIIVLTAKKDVYTIGNNTNGQLGLPLQKTAKWTKILPSFQGEIIVGVKAGPRSSFIVTKIAHHA